VNESTVITSFAAVASDVVIVMVEVAAPVVRRTLSPLRAIVVAFDNAAFAGITDNRPNPIADTATSAMRLRSVFVDICFLSISQDQEFPDLGFG
jgi:hypothetical protein